MSDVVVVVVVPSYSLCRPLDASPSVKQEQSQEHG